MTLSAKGYKMHEVGFVYVLTNPYYVSGLVKIGQTGLLAEDRAKKLFTTGVPAPFTVEYRTATSRPVDVEERAHTILATQRVNSSREFFFVTVDEAVETIRLSAVEAGGIASWKSPSPHYLRAGGRLALSLEAGQTFFHLTYPDPMSLLAGKMDVANVYQAHSNGDLLEILVTDSPESVSSYSEGHYWGVSDPVPFLDRDGKAVNGIVNGKEILTPGERLVWLPEPDQAASQFAVIFEAVDYCQLVSRTWSPQFIDNIFSLNFDILTVDQAPPESVVAVQAALKLPVPRHWAPHSNRSDEWVKLGSTRRPPNYWLPQLKIRKRSGQARG